MIIGVAVLVLGLGAGAFIVLNKDKDEAKNDSASQTDDADTSDTDTQEPENALGADFEALEGSYKMTISGTQSGEKVSSVYVVDEDGDMSTVYEQDGESFEMRVVGGVTYMQMDGSWFKYPAQAGADNTINPDDFAITPEDISAEEQAGMKSLGTQDCVAGRCRVYELNDMVTETKSIIQIDEDTNRIVSVSNIDETTGDELTITYEYDENTDVVAPANAQEFGVPQQ